MKIITIVPSGFRCTLAECDPGLFLFKNTIGFKSEYGDCEAFVVESGEYFWGGTSDKDDRKKLMVIPCNYAMSEDR